MKGDGLMKAIKKTLTIKETADEYLQVSEKTVRRLILDCCFECVSSVIGQRIITSSLLEYLNKQAENYKYENGGKFPVTMPDTINDPRMIPIQAAMGLLTCSRAKIISLIDEGQITACLLRRPDRTRGLIRVSAASVERFQKEKILQFSEKDSNDSK
jgi:hypothetical protein